MIMSGILVGIFGNVIFVTIQALVKDFFGENDENLKNRIYELLEMATKEFFENYGEVYIPQSSFLARESNIKLIIRSFFYGNNINLYYELDRQGFDNDPDVSEEHLLFFIETLNKLTEDDFLLSKIKTQKNYYEESKNHFEVAKETNNNVNKILDSLNKVPSKGSEKNKWMFYDNKTGKETPVKIGKRYTDKFSNGVEFEYMFNDAGTVHVNFKDIYGRVTYSEFDLDGNAKNTKLPFDLSEYTLVLPKEEVNNYT